MKMELHCPLRVARFPTPPAACTLSAMEINVTKMHGLGNDFVLVDGLSSGISLSPEQITRIADRRLGVGCDQVLLVERPRRSGIDANYRIFNADGGEVEQCGNGARCVARYLRTTGWVDRDTIIVETLAGIIHLYCQDDGQVQVDTGAAPLGARGDPRRSRSARPKPMKLRSTAAGLAWPRSRWGIPMRCSAFWTPTGRRSASSARRSVSIGDFRKAPMSVSCRSSTRAIFACESSSAAPVTRAAPGRVPPWSRGAARLSDPNVNVAYPAGS